MSDPRYVPCLWAREPGQFGRRLDVRWRDPATSVDRSELDAARRQNLVTVRIRGALDEQGRTIRWYAQQVGCSYDRMTRLLRGEIVMRLQDITDAERILRLAITFTIETTPGSPR
ncbi:hypothetical protein SJ20_05790 [Micrococcus sp. MS-ASIII-49]|uniref:hypothetical protein n=1 Tax=Micrococcus sp. MS-ASIII-49 TaxID=1593237 RepID=UPI0005CBD1F2|nr:hypothetical protein [Micrococcus sp. MS-ASIII-49]RYD00125.1 hypothetical protein SJ20_05790 [Micrococcus sp. MS-ASIII-49]